MCTVSYRASQPWSIYLSQTNGLVPQKYQSDPTQRDDDVGVMSSAEIWKNRYKLTRCTQSSTVLVINQDKNGQVERNRLVELIRTQKEGTPNITRCFELEEKATTCHSSVRWLHLWLGLNFKLERKPLIVTHSRMLFWLKITFCLPISNDEIQSTRDLF